MKRTTKFFLLGVGVLVVMYRDEIIKRVVPFVVDNFAVGEKNLGELTADLRQSQALVERQLKNGPDTEANRQLLGHIIGIERWGQRRLKVALGEPFVLDEHDGYRPPAEHNWEQLQQDFTQTRQETIAVAEKLAEAAIPASTTVPHNQAGNLTLRSWLFYLRFHAEGELKRLAV